ncbi:major facilitator superfamily domain-containing protein [Microdochium trichocladiopsis]|uniref:Major facilitator superfamily domain-containing protein n=1 Tax=Microdochium trichocladiopsis TaxID=1682393 RepID=A0A9P9BV26_9PEZI|nr:major facilitator superfamily domain-containing protein [Microdochium trichocladiopsis]KAH7041591.1 major facilitator superfamily domain-containing protein [Microdochium trichocladiopsis]
MTSTTRDNVSEQTPLLRNPSESGQEDKSSWTKPKWFLLIQIALFSNVFLAGFDGTVTASTYSIISSEFHRSDLASWITTSYLLASTAVQPLYGRFSDVFGRRACLLFATASFGLGCLGCALSANMGSLIFMRAVTGLGGGGLMTMSTIINSDLIPTRHRGMYQAIQNILHGFGAICGASVGGIMADAVGWRFCFLSQVGFVAVTWVVAFVFVQGNGISSPTAGKLGAAWRQIDVTGAALLFVGLVLQLAGISLGSNELSWSHPIVISVLATSCLMLAAFVVAEARCKTVPILPLGLLAGREKVALLVSNVSLGMTAYGFLFLMPLLFQTALLDSASVAGLRMVPPSLATPLGGLSTGIVMRRRGSLVTVTRVGLVMLLCSNALMLSLPMGSAEWKFSVFPIPGNFGSGMIYPSILFSFIRASGIQEHAVATSLVYLTRSMGTMWGVSVVSTIVQNLLPARLETALPDFEGRKEMIEQLLKSTTALRELPLEIQGIVRGVYYGICQVGIVFLLAMTAVGLVCSFLVRE